MAAGQPSWLKRKRVSEDLVDADTDSMIDMQRASPRQAPAVMLNEHSIPLEDLSEINVPGTDFNGGNPLEDSGCVPERLDDDDPRMEEVEFEVGRGDDPDEVDTTTPRAPDGLQIDLLFPSITNQEYRVVKKEPPVTEISTHWEARARQLCSHTGTESAFQATVDGMLAGLGFVHNPRLRADVTQSDFSAQAYAYMVAVWLLVCFMISDKTTPKGRFVSRWYGSLCTSAWQLMPTKIAPPLKEFVNHTAYWEWLLYVKKSSWFHVENWAGNIPKNASLPVTSPAAPCARALLQAFKTPTGLTSLAKRLLEVEKADQTTPIHMLCREKEERWALREMIQLLASVHPSVVESCIRQRVARDALINDHETAAELRRNGFETNKPVIYLNSLCDRSGMPPTPRQWHKAVKIALDYISADSSANDVAEKIDQAICPPRKWRREVSHRGFRRYMDYRNLVIDGLNVKNEGRRRITEYFLTKMLARVSTDFALGRAHTPFSEAVGEVGFTKNPKERLRNHARHVNSNYIMNLMESVFEVLFPSAFTLQQQVLHVCWRPCQAWLGEILFTRLCNAYTNTAGGFCHYPAGYSNGGAYRCATLVDWHRWERQADDRFKIEERLEDELKNGKQVLSSIEDELKKENEVRQQEEAAAQATAEVMETWLDVLDILLESI